MIHIWTAFFYRSVCTFILATSHQKKFWWLFYKEVIEGATEGIADLASEREKDAADGYAKGISDNTDRAEDSAKTFVERVMEKIAETQDSHSPS